MTGVVRADRPRTLHRGVVVLLASLAACGKAAAPEAAASRTTASDHDTPARHPEVIERPKPVEDTAPPAPTSPSPPPSPYPPVRGQGVIETGHGPIRRADTETACRACGGSWGRHGIVGAVGCICGTTDAGKACKSPLDCESECLIDDPDVYREVRCGPSGCNGPEPVGHCAPLVVNFGCHSRIAEMPHAGGVVREVHTICLD